MDDLYKEYLGKKVIYRTLGERLTGLVRMPTQDHDFLIVTPARRLGSEVIHVSDIISIIA